MHILLVEDEPRIASFIKRGLKEERYTIDVASTAEDALAKADTNDYDLIILDIILPDKNGVTVCQELRSKQIQVPVLMLTAKDSVRDKIEGLDAGADDYLTKPFDFAEFLARVRALLRRQTGPIEQTITVGDLELDPLTHTVTRASKAITLTNKEYAVLEYLMRNANQVVTRTMLAEHVWDTNFDSFSNVIDVHINYVRRKIDKGFAKPLLHTVRGVGYTLKA